MSLSEADNWPLGGLEAALGGFGAAANRPTRAAVEFHSDLGPDGRSGPYFGDAVLTESGWQLSHASYCEIIIPAGVHCP
jgi:hypothetical protein